MTMEEFKKKVYDTVEPMLDGQGIINFDVKMYDELNILELHWWDARDDSLILAARVSEIQKDPVFQYCLTNCCNWDRYDMRFNSIMGRNADYSDSLYHLCKDYDGVEKTLRDFTEWLVKIVHDV